MAAAINKAEWVHFELYWQGEKTWYGRKISTLEFSTVGLLERVEAKVESVLPVLGKEQLDFRISKKQRTRFTEQKKTYKAIACPLEVAPTLSVTARIKCEAMHHQLQFGAKSMQEEVKVSIVALPNFRGGGAYCIKVVNCDNKLSAGVEKKDERDWLDKLKDLL